MGFNLLLIYLFSQSRQLRPDFCRFRFAVRLCPRIRDLGRDLRLRNLFGQLCGLFVVALGYGLVQQVHQADRFGRRAAR